MSQFEGSPNRVRCLECTNLSGKHCTAKSCSVSPKKRRVCTKYAFKGEYENRTPHEAIYVPYVDPKTKKLLKKLVRLGLAVPDGSHQQNLVIPATTATTGLIAPVEKKEPSLIWTPGNDDE